MMKKENAITLIALIISIVILIILTSVTITNIFNSRILEFAKEVTNGYVEAEIQERQAVNDILTIIRGKKSSVTKIIDESPGDITDGGKLDGSANNPYEISSIEDLIAFGKGKDTYLDKTVILTRNLDFNSKDSYVDSQNTELFGDYNNDTLEEGIMQEILKGGYLPIDDFSGTFDGKGYTVSNFKFNMSPELDRQYIGFICDVQETGSIKNLNVSGEINFIASELELYHYRLGGITGRNKERRICRKLCIKRKYNDRYR